MYLYQVSHLPVLSTDSLIEKIRAKLNELKPKVFDNTRNWIGAGVGVGIGAAVFAITNQPVWIALGVAIGAALCWRKPKDKKRFCSL